MEINDDLSSSQTTLDLQKNFPMSRLSLLKRSWKWLLALLVTFILMVAPKLLSLGAEVRGAESFSSTLSALGFYAFFFTTAIVSLKLIYEEFFFATFRYGISEGHMVVVSGVFAKTRSSYPLSRLTDVYLERDIVDFLLGLYNLNLVTANAQSQDLGLIHGLPRNIAVAFQDYVTSLVSKVHPENQQAIESTEITEVVEEPDSDH